VLKAVAAFAHENQKYWQVFKVVGCVN